MTIGHIEATKATETSPAANRLLLTASDTSPTQNEPNHWQPLAEAIPGATLELATAATEIDGTSYHAVRLAYRIPSDGDETRAVVAALTLNQLDARNYDHLSMLIKGDPETGFNPSLTVGFHKPHPQINGMEEVASYRVAEITSQWQRVTIPLHGMVGITDWNGLTSFRVVLPQRDTPVRQGAYFIADLSLSKTGDSGPSALDQVIARNKDSWEQDRGGQSASRHALRERLIGWPSAALIDSATVPTDDHEFLLKLARDTWRGIDALTDREHGLPLDRVHFDRSTTAVDQAFIGDYTSTTNIGFHLLSIVAAHELRFISAEEALTKLGNTLASLEKMETYKGFFYNYYNTTTLERTSDFISFVDSAWLTAGLMVTQQAFPPLADRCHHLIGQGDYRFFYDPGWNLMSHGYYTNLDQRATYHYGSLFSEARLGSLIAIGQ